MSVTDKKIIKCAIYTRKSSEEGLEQDFNSLDAQREACEAYIKSQRHEGWVLVEKQYNDGGISGGTLERPAIKELFEDVKNGEIDTVVVYKVDRLTRSLMDFSKIVELFDSHETSFVSITQQFNTTTSMGRLTLNILLSFAQFEREVTGERIRDKMAASKKKGMWMNGTGPLGYTNKDRTLEIDEENAKTIRLIFDKYFELKSVHLLKVYLEENKITTKSGKDFSKGHLYKILSNKTYIGKITHKDNVYEGLHDGIVDEDVFDKVQKLLADNRINQKNSDSIKNPSLLAGKLFDDKNNYMSPSHSNTRNRKYRYYISQAIIQHRRNEAGSVSKIPAGEVENVVVQEVKNFLTDNKNLQEYLKDCNLHKQKDLLSEIKSNIDGNFIRTILSKVIIYKEKIEIIICKTQLLKTLGAIYNNTNLPEEIKGDTEVPITISKNIRISATAMNGSVLILSEPGEQEVQIEPQLVKAIIKSHYWNNQILSGEVKNSIEIKEKENLKSKTYVNSIIELRFLAPEIIERILSGTQPRDLTIQKLFNIKTFDWAEQKKLLCI
jgi:DNA invertase Pin-like site-specific DNA recombinase